VGNYRALTNYTKKAFGSDPTFMWKKIKFLDFKPILLFFFPQCWDLNYDVIKSNVISKQTHQKNLKISHSCLKNWSFVILYEKRVTFIPLLNRSINKVFCLQKNILFVW